MTDLFFKQPCWKIYPVVFERILLCFKIGLKLPNGLIKPRSIVVTAFEKEIRLENNLE